MTGFVKLEDGSRPRELTVEGGPGAGWEVNSGAPDTGFTCGGFDLSILARPPRTSFETSTY